MDFIERTPLEKGFGPLFQSQIRPALLTLEGERIARLAKARRSVLISLGAGVGLALLVMVLLGGSFASFVIGFMLFVFGGIGAIFFRRKQAAGWSGAVAEAVMPTVCAHVGALRYDPIAADGFPIRTMQDLGLIGGYDNARLSDRLDGRHRDTPFEMVEARLTRQTRDSDGDTTTETVFGGLLFRIAVPLPVPTPILITRDFGAIGNKLGAFLSGKKGRGMPRAEMNHAEFEEFFEVHAEDPQAARAFMPPGFLDNLLTIGKQEGGRKGAKAMRAGFVGDSFYLALERSGDFLAMGSLTRPVEEMEEDLHAVFADIEMVHRIIDRLHGVDTA